MIIIDNNFLSEEEVNEVEKTILSDSNHWYFHNSKEYYQSEINKKEITVKNESYTSSIYFTNVFFLDINDFPYADNNPSMKKVSEKILNKFLIKNNIELHKIIRMRSNINTINKNNFGTPPHIDQTDPHFVFLYYINDSDGDTVIYKEKYNGKEINSLEEKARITPKAGTAVVFDGLLYHSITPPKENLYRSVININFYGKNNNIRY
jgi:hypothetical protein